MLRDEVARYTELSGNDGLHTPIGIIGAYLDGYEKGRADAQPKLDENTLSEQQESDKLGVKTGETCTDCISRQAAIDALREVYEYEYPTASGGFDEYATKLVPNTLKNLPSAQPETCPYWDRESNFCALHRPSAHPTLYGYSIEHLALIATIMQKENVTPEKAIECFKDIQRIVQMVLDEQQEMIRKAVE